jgi:hypothetical protein
MIQPDPDTIPKAPFDISWMDDMFGGMKLYLLILVVIGAWYVAPPVIRGIYFWFRRLK